MSTCNSEEVQDLANPVITAAPPYLPARPRPFPQFVRLVQVMLAEYRSMWALQVFFGFVMPMGMMYLMKYIIGGLMTPERAVFALGGNMVSSIAYGPVMLLISRIGASRQNRSFDYWANLPIAPLTWILAMSAASLILALPGLAAVYLVGSLMLDLSLARGLAILPLVPLVTLSLTGIGAFLGAYARNVQVANILSNALVGFVSFLSPIMIPLEAMPAPLQWIARLIPTTYAAQGFRAALAGHFGPGLAVDLFILVLLMAVSLVLVHRKLDWRAR